jgi:hypothetical protein
MQAVLMTVLTLAAAGPALEGTRSLPAGRRLRFSYDFDRNAIAESVEVDSRFVALTHSGDLVLFADAGRTLLRSRVMSSRARCLGRGRAGVLVGFDDGTVARLDLATLQPVVQAQFPAPVLLVGESVRGELVAVTERSDPGERTKRRMHEVTSEVHVAANGTTVVVHHRPWQMLIDRQNRLWLGTNNGEWGGGIEVVSLSDGETREMSTPDHAGVNGFLERSDGAVWSYGGTDHMGLGQSFAVRVDGPEPVTLFAGRAPPLVGRRGRDGAEIAPIGPGAAILQLIELDGSLVAFTYKGAFTVDAAFRAWRPLLEARARPWPNLPGPLTQWPLLRRVHSLGAGKFLLATERAGYLLVDGAHETSLTVPHQLGLERVQRIVPAGRDVFFYAAPWDRPWRRIPSGFEPVDLRPFSSGTAGGNADEPGWTSSTVVPAPGGGLVMFTHEDRGRSHTLLIARSRGSRPAMVTRQTSGTPTGALFFTPDGELWKAKRDELFRLVDNEWKVGRLETDPRQWLGVLHARALDTRGPTYWIHDEIGKRLYRLGRPARSGEGATPVEARMAVVDVREGGVPLDVLAAEPWGERVLLATTAGLRLLSVGDGGFVSLSPAPLSIPAGAAITRIARDGLGRLWLGGQGLWLVTRAGAEPMALNDSLPLRHAAVAALGRSPIDAHQMMVAFQNRGVMAVSVGGARAPLK